MLITVSIESLFALLTASNTAKSSATYCDCSLEIGTHRPLSLSPSASKDRLAAAVGLLRCGVCTAPATYIITDSGIGAAIARHLTGGFVRTLGLSSQ